MHFFPRKWDNLMDYTVPNGGSSIKMGFEFVDNEKSK